MTHAELERHTARGQEGLGDDGVKTLAATKFFMPAWAKQGAHPLPLAARALKGWGLTSPPQQRPNECFVGSGKVSMIVSLTIQRMTPCFFGKLCHTPPHEPFSLASVSAMLGEKGTPGCKPGGGLQHVCSGHRGQCSRSCKHQIPKARILAATHLAQRYPPKFCVAAAAALFQAADALLTFKLRSLFGYRFKLCQSSLRRCASPFQARQLGKARHCLRCRMHLVPFWFQSLRLCLNPDQTLRGNQPPQFAKVKSPHSAQQTRYFYSVTRRDKNKCKQPCAS